ncbi:MFS transporter [Quadrisphaera granulorum]|uniref:MFS transporter n=1 Tax=Quadrisphaera granulorum TaxID=317664 RepID=UPI001B86B449|nr:MFS transporter [Quadrisphaera granulorum]
MLIAATYGLGRYAYGFFVPVFRVEFDLNTNLIGIIAAGSYVTYCLAIVASTVLTPRLGARTVAVGAGCLATLGLAMVTFAPTAGVVAAGVLIAGSSTGASSPPLAQAVAHAIAERSRDRVQTVINASAGAGIAVIGPVAFLTQEHWRAAWFVFAAACAAVTVYVAIALAASTGERDDAAPRPALLPRPLLPSGSARLITASALMGAASAAVATFGRDVLTSIGRMSETSSTTAWILLGAAGVLGASAGDLTRRWGLRAAWSSTMALMGCATVLLASAPGIDVVAWAAAAVFGASYMTLTGLLLIWGTQTYSLSPAAGVGLAFLVMALGQAAAAPIVGGLLARYGALPAFVAAAVLAIAGAFLGPTRATDPCRAR